MNNIVKKIALVSASAGLSLGLINSASAADETFTSKLTLLAPITVTNTSDLDFGTYEGGQNNNITVAAADAGAATFSSTGEASTAVTGVIVESSIEMTTGDGIGTTKRITVDTWTYGGDMDASGVATYDGSGNLSNLRVGGTAHAEVEDIAGNYTGTATFRVTYN